MVGDNYRGKLIILHLTILARILLKREFERFVRGLSPFPPDAPLPSTSFRIVKFIKLVRQVNSSYHTLFTKIMVAIIDYMSG